jgi:CheY-like chemotaxis protein
MNAGQIHFIVIDDSKLDCLIAEKMIQHTKLSAGTLTYTLAPDALDHICQHTPALPTLIFVDIQMPIMNGFEFIEAFEKLPQEIRMPYTIAVVSSSINESDIARANSYQSVKRFINKPLTTATIAHVVTELELL